MTKEELLKQFYIQQIAALVEKCSDTDLLDLIYRLLTNNNN